MNDNECEFNVNDKVKSIAFGCDKRWRGIVIEVKKRQVKVYTTSDKKRKDQFWVLKDNLVIIK